ncbi:MAG: phasin family protein [Candidatus Thiodiazotropha sp. (ex Lucina aurantia)]|uniref:Phasin protein n=1 Tax=Candidatus Thiodiazotropha endolucinida TaxID=1655433 RepID=A0A7Z1AEA1_9GAMM|nr:phasin family protein [Candidatus Thiodiazotropha endolucinida]MBT3013886.1 phasin family protein [Candidatus Thiodiazotropha sp. (ex Lucina pensylvanica)]MBT3018028.1 phasin family protein [Candidatus Thiodiazotropha taylori]MBT3040024.1 phasin family protein [Candidatus Thiodiazotropha sp. (ex Codakia orbicularis)]MBV2105300.1 phasin family protein [Candidatus Thiodiazotropha sp. (ex Lucina aurantia)]MBT3025458.1 phasin family protein [Candidatus Thiodiazotropha taylori]
MAKAKENIEMMSDLNTAGYESFRQLSDISLKAWNQVMEAQMNTLNTLMNTSMEQLKLVSEAKDYQEVVRGQMDLSRKLGEDLMSKTREAVELSQKTGEEVRGWYESNLATANEKISKVAEKAA